MDRVGVHRDFCHRRARAGWSVAAISRFGRPGRRSSGRRSASVKPGFAEGSDAEGWCLRSDDNA
jgi:dienelactone hydrolase